MFIRSHPASRNLLGIWRDSCRQPQADSLFAGLFQNPNQPAYIVHRLLYLDHMHLSARIVWLNQLCMPTAAFQCASVLKDCSGFGLATNGPNCAPFLEAGDGNPGNAQRKATCPDKIIFEKKSKNRQNGLGLILHYARKATHPVASVWRKSLRYKTKS